MLILNPPGRVNGLGNFGIGDCEEFKVCSLNSLLVFCS